MSEPDLLKSAVELLRTRLGVEPRARVGLVLGSGLSMLADEIVDPLRIPSAEVPGLPGAGVVGHKGEVIFGKLRGTEVVCLSGRAHLYEGHPTERVVFGVQLLAEMGCGEVVLTNAAGGIAKDCGPGTLMLITDHLNLTGASPLVGPNDDAKGPRFPDMSEVYSARLRKIAGEVAEQEDIVLASGVYAGMLGPSYETPAEIRMLETLGASAVGMSTVLEAISLRHRSVNVLGVSCITNHAAGKSQQTLSHEEVAEVAGATSAKFCTLIAGICAALECNGLSTD